MFMKMSFAAVIASALLACGQGSEAPKTELSSQAVVSKPILNKLPPRTKKTADDLPHYLTRDIQDDVFYFVMPDRFYNGDPSNDHGSDTIAISQGGFNPKHKGAYHGGDIQGLTAKLPYLKNMGISAIWLTPILRNQAVQGDISGYHGYWVLDFTEIDPHLGSNDDLKAFINAAHQENIKVFFDIITNHTADVIKYEECHDKTNIEISDGEALCEYKSLAQKANGDSYTPFLPTGMEDIKSPQWLNDPKYYHNQGDSTFEGENSVYGDFFGLDDINTDDPEVVSGMIDIFKNIISEFKPDGFRIDTVKHVNIEFWQQFALALLAHANKEGLPKFFMFGEVYSGDPDVLSHYTTTGNMQSVLDFGFQGTVKNVIVDQQGTDELAKLFSNDNKYDDQDSDANQLLNFVGNHDMGRFAWMLENSKFNYSDDEKLARLKLAHAMMYFLRGIPVIYYGTEQGFVGDGGNHDSRQDMMPSKVATYNDDILIGSSKTTADDNFDERHPLYQAFQAYADIYYQYPTLRFGNQKTIYSSDKAGIFMVSRTFNSGQKMLVAINTANTEMTLNLATEALATDLLKGTRLSDVYHSTSKAPFVNDEMLLTLAPLSISIFNVN